MSPILKSLRLPNTAEPFAAIRPYLEGRVFHVSRLANLEAILACGEIRPNQDGSLVTTFGSASNSFFVKRGCVCLFDYRFVTPGQLEESAIKCSPMQPLTHDSGIVIFILCPRDCPDLVSWQQWKQEEAWSEQVVPHVETGHSGPIPLNLIDEIICVEKDDDPNSFASKLQRAIVKNKDERQRGPSRMSLARNLLCCLSIFSADLMALDAKADVRVSDETEHSMTIEIKDEITEKDALTFAGMSERLARKTFTVHLDSKGGDVFAAMKIGRTIRQYDGWTWNDSICYSSCALIFIAGVIRTNDYAEIGLHRPYLASSPQSRETIEKKLPIMLATIKGYVDEMGAPNIFYEQMIRTEPSTMAVYRDDAIYKIIPEHDPIFDEVVIATMARKYGITTSEMRRRDKDAKKCPDNRCREAIYWGLREQAYATRYAESKMRCWFNENERFDEEETKMFWRTPARKRLDLSFFVRFEACTRNIMKGR